MATVRFPEDDIGINLQSFDQTKFEPTTMFEDETFGFYDEVFVAVKTEDLVN